MTNSHPPSYFEIFCKMRIQWDLATFLICALHLVTINIPSTFLFRRKNVHHIVNDPFQAIKPPIARGNLFAWLNLNNQVKFKLWTRKNPKLAHEIRIGDLKSLTTSNFDSRRLTKIIVHGYAHSANEIYLEDWIVELRDNYLYLADLNVMIIDYTFFALPAFYWTAGSDLAARQLTAMIKFLLENKQITLEGLHVLGFSWGAHIAGVAGSHMGGKIGRITGLDPAQPTFRLVDDTRRLDKSDAQFVDIIHTNSGRPFMEGHLGLGIPLGHADYYPNSGRAQPGCRLTWTYAYEEIECDHARSVNVYTESIISPLAFPSCLCDNWDHYVKGECPCDKELQVFMGEHTDRNARGKYYLFTRDKKPYGLGSQMNISLPDIDQYDPDFNNTGYHYHLRPYSLKEEPRMPTTSNEIPTDIYTAPIIDIEPQIISNDYGTGQPSYSLSPPPSTSQVYWEPQNTFVIKSEPITEFSYLGYDDNDDNNVKSNHLKRHSDLRSSKTANLTEERLTLARMAEKQKKFTPFTTQLYYRYINKSSKSSQLSVSLNMKL